MKNEFSQEIIERLVRLEEKQSGTDIVLNEIKTSTKEIKSTLSDMISPMNTMTNELKTLREVFAEDRMIFKGFDARLIKLENKIDTSSNVAIFVWSLLKWVGAPAMASFITFLMSRT